MTDSVLDGLFAQLEGEFDRTLLLVIADRYDELESGAGEGWRAMHSTKRDPKGYYATFSFSWGLHYPKEGGYLNALPMVWYSRLMERCYMQEGRFVFKTLATAYMAAAEAWMEMTKFQRLRALEELK